jgi:serine/threonine protein kinase
MGDQIQLTQKLGEGSSGTVYQAVCLKTRNKLAVKAIDKKKGSRVVKRAREEAEIMSQLSHKHICKCFGIVENSSFVFLMLQQAEGGDLLDLINRTGSFSERDARRVLQQLILAVRYLHHKGYVHRDIKPENIFLDASGNVLLGDFGFATRWSPLSQLDDSVGTFPYAAPELLSRSKYVGPEVDVFSLGTVLLALLSATTPFSAATHQQSLERMLKCEFDVPPTVSELALDLLSRMLDPNPKTRITMEQLCKHKWLKLSTFSPPKALTTTTSILMTTRRKLLSEFRSASRHSSPVAVAATR